MRFILEHPWLASISIAAIAFALTWTGLRDGLGTRVKIGLVVFGVSICSLIVGLLIDTPTEHAKGAVYTFVQGVEDENISAVFSVVHQDVILVDHWDAISSNGIQGVQESIKQLHEKHPLSFNTILRFQAVEREEDVLVELSMLSRVSRIGTVPSVWRILVMPNEQGTWKIYSIDAIEIMGKSYR